MADFVQNSQTKSAIRELADPIADVAAFNTIVQSVITGNPFACVSYMTAGTNHPPVEKTREAYTARIVYEDTAAKNVGTGTHRFNTLAGFTAGVTALLFEAALVELVLAPLFDPLAAVFAPGKMALKLVVASETNSPKIDCGCPCWKSR